MTPPCLMSNFPFSHSGVMVWPNTYGEEDVEISYNMSDKASWMKMSNILHEFLMR